MTPLRWLDRVFRGKGKKDFHRRQKVEGSVGVTGTLDLTVDRRTASGDELGPAISPEEPAITEEELSGLDDRDREMLRSIIELDYTSVRELMVPRLDMVAIEADVSLEEATEAIVQHGHSRIPVYVETIDHILGILYVRDLLAAVANPKEGHDLRLLTRPAYIVPETKRVDELLEEFRQRRTQIAIVVDEYGGTEGLVTMEDVLEEIVGEIEDEFSRALEAEILRQGDGTVFVNAGLGTEEVEDLFGVNIESDDFDTIGGYVYHELGRIPQVGDVVAKDDLRVEVMSVAGRRLRRLKLTSEAGDSMDSSG